MTEPQKITNADGAVFSNSGSTKVELLKNHQIFFGAN